MILAGMVTLLFIAKNHPFLAGVCSMVSCLCWQPGLLFTGVAFLSFTRYLTRLRDLRGLKVLAGAAVPLALVLVYFRAINALGELWTWTIAFNYSIYSRKALDGDGNPVGHIVNVALKIFQTDIILVALSVIGFVLFAIKLLRETLKGKRSFTSSGEYRDAILIAPLVYLAACFIRFKAGPYLIPFLPFICIFFGWMIVESARAAQESRLLSGWGHALARWLPQVVLVILLCAAGYRAVAYQFESQPTLHEQDQRFATLSGILGDSENIYVHGTTEILVLLNRANLNPYVFLDYGKDDYLADKSYGGDFSAVINEIESKPPKIVALSRLKRVVRKDELKRWAELHYESLGWSGYEEISVRKPDRPMDGRQ
jgi:hypothetical protein